MEVSLIEPRPAIVAYIFIGILLIATTMQASHVCGEPPESTYSQHRASGDSATHPCQICLKGQTPILSLVFVVFSTPRTPAARTAFLPGRPRSVADFFLLSVRPPPVL